MGSQGGFGQSKEFLDLVKSIGETRSKAEEDRIVLREIETLKRRIIEPDTPKRKMKEYIIRLVYVEMLGHDASFGYIHAVKMTHDDNLSLKRTGYLAVTLFLNEDHDLIILIVNTIQKDLKSDNFLVVCAALNAVCRLINEETIPAVLPQVVELLGHQKEAVRKKAVMALHRFYQRSPSSVSHLISNFRKRLCDNDPGVMGATLCPLFDLITIDPVSYKDLVISFVNILKQIAERRLPKGYDYHQMPAPFIQIKLLKILAMLGNGDKQASGQMYTVVGEIMKKCDTTSNIGNAILYEGICCVATLHPNPKLLGAAAEAISKLLKSDSHNLKYLGIDALGRLIKTSPEIAEQHQLAVIDCLEDPDHTLKRKTFELLYKMTKSSNVEVIADRMIDYMISIDDSHIKTEIASRCVELAEQFAPSNQWFIQTMNRVFEHAGDLVNAKVAHNLMRLIAEGFGEDDETADNQLRSSAVTSYLRLIGEPKLPSTFLQVICWVLGEYGTSDGKYSASYISGKLCDVAEAYSSNDTVKGYAVTGLMKLYSFEIAAGRKVDILPECQSLIEELSASHSTDLQQRAYELQAIVGLDSPSVETIMPLDASCEDIEIDKSLPFLDSFVQQALEKGADPYIPESLRSAVLNIGPVENRDQHEPSHALRFEAYELPKPISRPSPVSLASSTELVPVPEPIYSREIHQSDKGTTSELRLKLDGVQKKWGKPSYSHPSVSDEPKTTNGTKQPQDSLKRASSSEFGKQQAEITVVPSEKKMLAASLFGGPSKKPPPPTSGHKVSKSGNHHQAVEKTAPLQPQPDLLDLGEPSVSNAEDPFKQLEGLLGSGQDYGSSAAYSDMPTSSQNQRSSVSDLLSSGAELTPSTHNLGKGSDTKNSLQKDSLVRQMGVTPSTQNPNLFKDLLG
ncbi:AP-4 complex subunit epsilon-like [Impatiens glandulifera]|uniref:AP-4 complex subunit epsilon-like n=1 Tax=Impatiens glandulifera TaxID=253017 RepID=UPI001FB11857|nr:AP-4 complex subunit epsilon-like [Impatiens glandulifera]